MRLRVRAALAVLAVCCGASVASAATYCVDVSCGTNGDGSCAACGVSGPWNSIPNIDCAGAGVGANDIIELAAGTYTLTSNWQVPAACSGTSGNPVIIQNTSGEAVVVNGVSDSSGGAVWTSIGSGIFECTDAACVVAAKIPFTAWYDTGGGENRLALDHAKSTGGGGTYSCTAGDGPAQGEMRYDTTGLDKLCVRLNDDSDPDSANSMLIPKVAAAFTMGANGADYITYRVNPSGGSFRIERFRDHGINLLPDDNLGITIDGLSFGWVNDRCINHQCPSGSCTRTAAATVIQNNTVEYCGQEGIRLSGDTSSSAVVSNNTISNIQVASVWSCTAGVNCLVPYDRGTAIRLAEDTGTTVENNTVYNIGGLYTTSNGIHLEIDNGNDATMENLLIDSNYLYNSTGMRAIGFGCCGSSPGGSETYDGIAIRNNRMHNIGSCFHFDAGVALTVGTAVETVNIQNNTCSDALGIGGGVDVDDGTWAITANFTNNIFVTTSGTPSVMIDFPTGSGSAANFQTPTYGSYYCTTCTEASGDIIDWKGTVIEKDGDCTPASDCVEDFDANSDYGDPNIDQSGSPPDLEIVGSGTALDLGTTIGAFFVDYEDEARPFGPAWDIGADEWAGAPIISGVTVIGVSF